MKATTSLNIIPAWFIVICVALYDNSWSGTFLICAVIVSCTSIAIEVLIKEINRSK